VSLWLIPLQSHCAAPGAYGRGMDIICAGRLIPRLMMSLTSTRRFCARPEAVVLSATASVFPSCLGAAAWQRRP
jgi:hypothetical protein